MDERIEGALKAACRAECPGAQVPGTLYWEMQCARVNVIVKQAYQDHDDRKGQAHDFVNPVKHDQDWSLNAPSANTTDYTDNPNNSAPQGIARSFVSSVISAFNISGIVQSIDF